MKVLPTLEPSFYLAGPQYSSDIFMRRATPSSIRHHPYARPSTASSVTSYNGSSYSSKSESPLPPMQHREVESYNNTKHYIAPIQPVIGAYSVAPIQQQQQQQQPIVRRESPTMVPISSSVTTQIHPQKNTTVYKEVQIHSFKSGIPAPIKTTSSSCAQHRTSPPVPASPTSPTSPTRKGIWTVEEHQAFLDGYEVYGNDWKRVSEEFVPTRSRSQLASHAQKYFSKMKKVRNLSENEKHTVIQKTRSLFTV
jgi:SHAQKYF class myb-like DNA-binding protein